MGKESREVQKLLSELRKNNPKIYQLYIDFTSHLIQIDYAENESAESIKAQIELAIRSTCRNHPDIPLESIKIELINDSSNYRQNTTKPFKFISVVFDIRIKLATVSNHELNLSLKTTVSAASLNRKSKINKYTRSVSWDLLNYAQNLKLVFGLNPSLHDPIKTILGITSKPENYSEELKFVENSNISIAIDVLEKFNPKLIAIFHKLSLTITTLINKFGGTKIIKYGDRRVYNFQTITLTLLMHTLEEMLEDEYFITNRAAISLVLLTYITSVTRTLTELVTDKNYLSDNVRQIYLRYINNVDLTRIKFLIPVLDISSASVSTYLRFKSILVNVLSPNEKYILDVDRFFAEFYFTEKEELSISTTKEILKSRFNLDIDITNWSDSDIYKQSNEFIKHGLHCLEEYLDILDLFLKSSEEIEQIENPQIRKQEEILTQPIIEEGDNQKKVVENFYNESIWKDLLTEWTEAEVKELLRSIEFNSDPKSRPDPTNSTPLLNRLNHIYNLKGEFLTNNSLLNPIVNPNKLFDGILRSRLNSNLIRNPIAFLNEVLNYRYTSNNISVIISKNVNTQDVYLHYDKLIRLTRLINLCGSNISRMYSNTHINTPGLNLEELQENQYSIRLNQGRRCYFQVLDPDQIQILEIGQHK